MFVASYVGMASIFLLTMSNLTQEIDYRYLGFAATRIALLSIPSLLVGVFVCRGGIIANSLVGLILGPMIGALYVSYGS